MALMPASISASAAWWSPSLSASDARARVFIIWTYGRYLSNSSLSRWRDGVPADERKEPQVPHGVERDEVVPLEVERREIAMVVLQSLAHQLRAVFRRERKRRAALGAPPGLSPHSIRAATRGLPGRSPSGRPDVSSWIRPRSMRIWIFSRPSSPVMMRT